MSDRNNRDPAPSDVECGSAWDRIMEIARKHALVVEAYGGAATLAIPCEQRKAGFRERVLRAHELREPESSQEAT